MKIPSNDDSTVLHALFPTLVYQASLDEPQEYGAAFAERRKESAFRPGVRGSARYNAGEYHGEILLHHVPELRPFFGALSAEVTKYLRVLGMKPEFFEMQCLKSWFVLCEPEPDADESMVAHNHSCSDISWVYYLDVPDASSPIKFHAGTRLKTEPFGSAFHYDWHNDHKSAVSTINWWNSDNWSVHPKEGDLLLFPGHQLHSVEANQSDKPRVSVAGDIALTLKEEFKDLEFGRTSQKHWLTLPLSDES